MYLGSWKINDYVPLVATVHSPTTGAASAPTSINYRIYEDDTADEIVAAAAATNFDGVTGLYYNRVQLTAAAGFEKGKNYVVMYTVVIGGITSLLTHTFQIEAEVDANTNSDKTGCGLADDAITSAKFDESTAFPLKSADAGSTAVARVGADSDTLETLSDQLDTITTKTNQIGSLAVTYTSPVASDDSVTIYCGADYSGAAILSWTITGWSGINVNGATGKLRLQKKTTYLNSGTATADHEFTATVTQASTTVTVTVALTDANTDDLTPTPPQETQQYRYQLVATVAGAGAEVQVLADGWLTAKKMLTASA